MCIRTVLDVSKNVWCVQENVDVLKKRKKKENQKRLKTRENERKAKIK